MHDQESAPPVAGAGLREDPTQSAVPAWAGPVVGLALIVFAAGFAVALYSMNPAFAGGYAAGAPDAIGKPKIEAGGGDLSAEAVEGRRLIGAKGCGGCHTVPGLASAKGSVGPSLAGVGSRRQIAGGAVPIAGPEDLAKWVQNPPALKPGTQMPPQDVTAEEAAKIAAYLATLK